MSLTGRVRGSRWLRLGVRLLGPALAVLIVSRLEHPGRLLDIVVGAAALPLLLALALNAASGHFKVLRWRTLLAEQGYPYGLRRSWMAFVAGAYLAMVTPGRVGDVLRIQYVKHDLGMPYSQGLAVIVMDRLCDMYVLAAIASIGLARFAHVMTGELGSLAWVTVAVVVLAPITLLVPGLADPLMRAVHARITGGGDEAGAGQFLGTLRGLVGRSLLVTIPLTLAANAVSYTQGWLIARAIGVPIAWLDVMSILAFTSLLSLIPISLSGVGFREAVCALVFPSLGATSEQGVVFALLVLGTLYVAWMVVGFVLWQVSPPPVSPRAGPAEPG